MSEHETPIHVWMCPNCGAHSAPEPEPSPTEWAYRQACRALEKHRAENKELREEQARDKSRGQNIMQWALSLHKQLREAKVPIEIRSAAATIANIAAFIGSPETTIGEVTIAAEEQS